MKKRDAQMLQYYNMYVAQSTPGFVRHLGHACACVKNRAVPRRRIIDFFIRRSFKPEKHDNGFCFCFWRFRYYIFNEPHKN